MRLREKVKSDSGLWLLHLGIRKLKIKEPEFSDFDTKNIEIKEKSAKRREHSHARSIAHLRKIIYGILIHHGEEICARDVYEKIKCSGYSGNLNIHMIVPFLKSLRNDIENNVTDEKLIELYKTHSAGEIGNMTNMCRAHVLDRLHQNGVKIRTANETKALVAARKEIQLT